MPILPVASRGSHLGRRAPRFEVGRMTRLRGVRTPIEVDVGFKDRPGVRWYFHVKTPHGKFDGAENCNNVDEKAVNY